MQGRHITIGDHVFVVGLEWEESKVPISPTSVWVQRAKKQRKAKGVAFAGTHHVGFSDQAHGISFFSAVTQEYKWLGKDEGTTAIAVMRNTPGRDSAGEAEPVYAIAFVKNGETVEGLSDHSEIGDQQALDVVYNLIADVTHIDIVLIDDSASWLREELDKRLRETDLGATADKIGSLDVEAVAGHEESALDEMSGARRQKGKWVAAGLAASIFLGGVTYLVAGDWIEQALFPKQVQRMAPLPDLGPKALPTAEFLKECGKLASSTPSGMLGWTRKAVSCTSDGSSIAAVAQQFSGKPTFVVEWTNDADNKGIAREIARHSLREKWGWHVIVQDVAYTALPIPIETIEVDVNTSKREWMNALDQRLFGIKGGTYQIDLANGVVEVQTRYPLSVVADKFGQVPGLEVTAARMLYDTGESTAQSGWWISGRLIEKPESDDLRRYLNG